MKNTNVTVTPLIGPTIERWEDPVLRNHFSDILCGNWRLHDPYELEGRLNAQNSLYKRPNQVSGVNLLDNPDANLHTPDKCFQGFPRMVGFKVLETIP
jgi:hypothetical protein